LNVNKTQMKISQQTPSLRFASLLPLAGSPRANQCVCE